jgi:hypothetical protein
MQVRWRALVLPGPSWSLGRHGTRKAAHCDEQEKPQSSFREGVHMSECLPLRRRCVLVVQTLSSEVGPRCRWAACLGQTFLPASSGDFRVAPRPAWKVRRTGSLECLPHIVWRGIPRTSESRLRLSFNHSEDCSVLPIVVVMQFADVELMLLEEVPSKLPHHRELGFIPMVTR